MVHTVFLDGKLRGVEDFDALAEALMDALMAAGATDPFVFTDAGAPSFHIEVAVEAPTQTQALEDAVSRLRRALETAGVAVESPSAQVAEPVPA